MDELFPQLPENLSEQTDAQLVELLDTYLDIEGRLHSADAELVGDRTNADVLNAMTELVGNIEAVKAEQTARDAEAEATRQQMDELHARAVGEEPTPDEDPEDEADAEADAEADPETGEAEAVEEPADEPVEEPQAVAAAAAPRRPFRAPVVTRDREPEPADHGAVIVASAQLPDVPRGRKLDISDVSKMMIDVRRSFGTIPQGMSEGVVVASVFSDYPEERRLDGGDPVETWMKIKQVIGDVPGSSLQAAALQTNGGLCAPTPVNYALDVVGVTDTPVVDSLPGFQATRGGIRYTYPPTLADVSAVGIITKDDVTAGGSRAVKTCQSVDCPDFTEVFIDTVYKCLEFGNLQARTYPELVAAWQQLTAIAFANVREVMVLDAIKDGSTKITTAAPVLGANAEFFANVALAAAAWRSRWRLGAGTRLRALFPAWLPSLLVADKTKRQFEDFDDNDFSEVTSYLAQFGIDPVFYLDGSSDGGQVFDAQTTGAIDDWPADMEWALYPEGTWLHLDGGQLDLGLVRDSTLNSTNNFQFFMEEFENVARIGSQSLWVTSPLCVTGAASEPVQVTCTSAAIS